MMELKNCQPKTSEDWAMVAKYESVEFVDEPVIYEVTEVECGVDEVDYDMD